MGNALVDVVLLLRTSNALQPLRAECTSNEEYAESSCWFHLSSSIWTGSAAESIRIASKSQSAAGLYISCFIPEMLVGQKEGHVWLALLGQHESAYGSFGFARLDSSEGASSEYECR